MSFHKYFHRILAGGLTLTMIASLSACSTWSGREQKNPEIQEKNSQVERTRPVVEEKTEVEVVEEATTQAVEVLQERKISWDDSWEYAEFSKIHSSQVTYYPSLVKDRKNIVVAVNAGHGTDGGESVKTPCHPDGSPKVTGGTTSEGATESMSISGGMTFTDGSEERDATLSLALLLKEELLEEGFDVLMLREEEDTQLDNIARTVFANNNANYHVSLHYDSTESDKGFFFISVPENEKYRSMEPVASHWKDHIALGKAILSGVEEEGLSVFSEGEMAMDLTQTSFSTIPSVDLEVGDAASDHSKEAQKKIAKAITKGFLSLSSERK